MSIGGPGGPRGLHPPTAAAFVAAGSPRRHRPRRRLLLALTVLALTGVIVASLAAWQQDRLPARVAAQLYPLEYQEEIGRAATRYGVDPFLVAAVIKTESGFDARAESQAGAVGLMQLMPATAGWIASRPDWRGPASPDLRRPEDNINLGTYYLAYLLDRFDGDRASALAAYNAGTGTVGRWLRQAEPDGKGLALESIPFPETRGFIDRVQRFHALYRRIHAGAFD